MRKTMVVWRRLGKEHGEESGFKLNSPDIVSAHIQNKVDKFSQTPGDDWRWWQLSDELIIEKTLAGVGFSLVTIIYYLPRRNWAIMENSSFPGLGKEWSWYVHIGELTYNHSYRCWIFTDFFCDVIIKKDNRTHSVLDLDDLGKAFEIGLITKAQLVQILADVQELIDFVRSGGFPPKEIYSCQKILGELG